MKLLFDQNLSPKPVNRLAHLFPDSAHVQSVGLDCASDDQVWEYARLNGFAIVTLAGRFGGPVTLMNGMVFSAGSFSILQSTLVCWRTS